MSIPLESLYRQAKAREAQLGDFKCNVEKDEVKLIFPKFTIRLLYCPELERVMAKCEETALLANINPNGIASPFESRQKILSEDGMGLPNLYGVSDRNDKMMRQWHESGWKCYR